MKRQTSKLWMLVAVVAVSACLDPFTPPKQKINLRILVVDGAYRPNDSTVIRLSRTVDLGAAEPPAAEMGARLEIENQLGQRGQLIEFGGGRYVLPPGVLSGARVKLHIVTANGAQYESDFSDVLPTPPIESMNYAFSPTDGLSYFLTTRAEANTPVFFRWEVMETWMYTAAYESVLRFEDGRIVPRMQSNFICWQTKASKNILIGSTTGRNSGLIANRNVLNIPARDERLRIKHSALVRQQAISPQAFEYWEQLAKNSQNLGSLFDPIPSELPGNIRCMTDPDEPVLGYFSASVVAEKRIFFDAATEPNRPAVDLPFQSCRLDTIRNLALFNSGIFEIVTALPFQFGYGFTYTLGGCIDCTSRGGTTTKPPFWE
jgi:hypothetical protein